jgi:CrcB protein
MLELLAVGAGGFIGAVARYLLSGLAHTLWAVPFPIGTLTVNVLGCLLIGALTLLLGDAYLASPNVRQFLLVGLLGAMTTFSTLGYETIEFLTAGQYWLAALNVAANVTLGLGAVILGRAAAGLVTA